jgi:hypothetical protein
MIIVAVVNVAHLPPIRLRSLLSVLLYRLPVDVVLTGTGYVTIAVPVFALWSCSLIQPCTPVEGDETVVPQLLQCQSLCFGEIIVNLHAPLFQRLT